MVPQKQQSQQSNVPAPAPVFDPAEVSYSPSDVMSAEAVCAWLRPGVSLDQALKWLAEKCRHRCVAPIPCRNIGRALIFSRIEILNWLQNLQRTPRTYPRRTKAQMAARAASARAAKAARKAVAA